jgi:regulator of replication initiation timing
MAEEQKAIWLNYLSATTVVIALCATLATFKGGGYGTRALLSQSQASDQWAFFQSKGIKQYLYEMQKENLELQLQQNKDGENTEVLKKRIDNYDQKISKYVAEKEEISKQAKILEAARDECKLHQDRFGLAVIFLQISILLSSITALLKKKALWYLSIVLGLVGIFYFFNGFWVFY